MEAIHLIRAPDYQFDILRLQQANALMRSANRAVAYGDDIELSAQVHAVFRITN